MAVEEQVMVINRLVILTTLHLMVAAEKPAMVKLHPVVAAEKLVMDI